MYISTLLNKLENDHAFDPATVTEAFDDFQLHQECQFLTCVKEGKITTTARDGKQLTITYPDGSSTLILRRDPSDDYMIYPSGGESYEATTESCCGVVAFVSRGEVVAVLPQDVVDNFCR